MTDIVTDEMERAACAAFDSDGGNMRAAITAALGAMWRPISEAPTDGSEVLAGFRGQKGEWFQFVGTAYTQGVKARYFEHAPPTHFAPLICPPAPEDV